MIKHEDCSVLLLVGFLPVVQVRFEHETIVAVEHTLYKQSDEDREGHDEPVDPVFPRKNRPDDRPDQQDHQSACGASHL